jgi:hypothetical protein
MFYKFCSDIQSSAVTFFTQKTALKDPKGLEGFEGSCSQYQWFSFPLEGSDLHLKYT